ncbi:MAG TPA: hypothetical protein VM370_07110, partial [Candidatus Thermoplasmatota archaeon]|nr:hypothetical protein [Candidatus Thermoplasmatota archaeon]
MAVLQVVAAHRPRMHTLRAAGIVLLLSLAPLASAALFDGAAKVSLAYTDSGRASAASSHVYEDWVRSYSFSVDWSRVGVYQLTKVGAGAYAGTGDEFREAMGRLEIQLVDQGVESTLDCTLSFNETKPATAGMLEYEGALVVTAGRGTLDDEAWDCTYGGNEVVHGGAQDVPLASFAFAAVEGMDAGTFPASLAVALGFADDAEEWTPQAQADATSEALESGYVEAEARTGKQVIDFERKIQDEDSLIAELCGDVSVDDTPADSVACAVNGSVTLGIQTVGAGTGGGSGLGSGSGAGGG